MRPSYDGDLNPVSIIEKWLKDHPEEPPKPELPEKLNRSMSYPEIDNAINAIIDYLAAKENS